MRKVFWRRKFYGTFWKTMTKNEVPAVVCIFTIDKKLPRHEVVCEDTNKGEN